VFVLNNFCVIELNFCLIELVLQIRNKREERVMIADKRWDEVCTWRGGFHEDEDLEQWGDVKYTSYSGMESRDPMLVDVGVDVTVQVHSLTKPHPSLFFQDCWKLFYPYVNG
jgi:hypothetical protein